MNFNKRAAIKCLVRVRHAARSWGMGFRSGDFLFTACHCLPSVPKNLWEICAVAVGRLKAGAVVIACDPIADVAVLAVEPDGGDPAPDTWSRDFDRLLDCTSSARIAEPWLRAPQRIHIHTHLGKWISGTVKLLDASATGLFVELDGGKRIIGGTSGAPIFADSGEVLGVVSSSPTHEANASGVHLAGALSMAIRERLRTWDE